MVRDESQGPQMPQSGPQRSPASRQWPAHPICVWAYQIIWMGLQHSTSFCQSQGEHLLPPPADAWLSQLLSPYQKAKVEALQSWDLPTPLMAPHDWGAPTIMGGKEAWCLSYTLPEEVGRFSKASQLCSSVSSLSTSDSKLQSRANSSLPLTSVSDR